MTGGRPVLAVLLFAAAAHAETVEIFRDAWGVPHIFAATPAGAAYGLGYAQAEDRPGALGRNLKGAEEVALAEPVRSMAEAFAAGVNRYFAEHPGSPSPAITAAGVVAYSRRAFQAIRGSNDFVLGATRTGGDGVIAVLDPMMRWEGEDRPYEMRLYIAEGGLALSGVAPVGVPFPLVGHSRRVAMGWSGTVNLAGPKALEQAWAMITAPDLAGVRAAMALGQIPGDLIAGASDGTFFDSAGRPAEGAPWESDYVMRPRASAQADAMVRKLLASQISWSPGRVAEVAFSAEVYKAETWQARLARADARLPFVQMLTGWDRRATAASVPALAFYLFKMELGRDAPALEPPDSLSEARVRAAIDRARDRFELEFRYGSNWGSLFRAARDGARSAYGVGGGTVTEAGMETPRAITFEERGAVRMGVAGQTAVQIVHLGKTAASESVLTPGQSDRPDSPHFDDQARDLFGKGLTKPSYFGDRKELEKHAKSKIELKF
jgi:acyl-homoserine lactone acylase PvdQ